MDGSCGYKAGKPLGTVVKTNLSINSNWGYNCWGHKLLFTELDMITDSLLKRLRLGF